MRGPALVSLFRWKEDYDQAHHLPGNLKSFHLILLKFASLSNAEPKLKTTDFEGVKAPPAKGSQLEPAGVYPQRLPERAGCCYILGIHIPEGTISSLKRDGIL